ncbi:hypothetical protein D3C80_1560550 [compost metagenome]
MKLHHSLIRFQGGLNLRQALRARHVLGHWRAFAHRIAQRPGAAALTGQKGTGIVTLIGIEADGPLENALHIREQPHLEFFAMETRAHAIEPFQRFAIGLGGRLLVAQRRLAAGHPVPGPDAVIGAVHAGGVFGQLPIQCAGLTRLPFSQ